MQVFFVLFAGHIRPNSQSARVESPISASIEFSGHTPAQFFPSGDAKHKKIAAPRSSPPEKFAREFCRRVQGFSRFFVTFAENKIINPFTASPWNSKEQFTK
ncbi:MAG TPA: hypothetical protein K8V55_00655 [Alistipes finegoldii]|jgi:hypothetical protein|uniref:hypothetical protein n=1 Tax=Alistipes finegoldii TaxID=214856 RepID=UPI001E1059D7|nr:hypothetical protein [Alistipes finegoldii]HJG72015.1 hypothetical protein [Alistipes finegoldii]